MYGEACITMNAGNLQLSSAGNHHAIEQTSLENSSSPLNEPQSKALDSIDEIQQSAPDFDFSGIIKEFADLLPASRNNPDRWTLGKKAFNRLSLLNNQNPEIGLKATIILAYAKSVSFIIADIEEEIFLKLKEFLMQEETPRRTRLEYGFFTWKNWFAGVYSKVSISELEPILFSMLLDESDADSGSASAMYDRFHESGFPFYRQPDFLLLAINLEGQRPRIGRSIDPHPD